MSFGDDGVLGLSFKRESEFGSSIFHEAVQEGLMDRPIFTTYLSKCQGTNCADGGLITFGDIDRENCGEVEAWANVVPGSIHWTFYFDGLKVNGKHVTGANHGITDTGSSDLFIPHSAAKMIAREVGARSDGGGTLLIRCSARFKITLIVGGKNFDITNEQLVLPTPGTSSCRLTIVGQDDDMWLFGDPLIRLNYSFKHLSIVTFRSYCQVHDVQQKRVGFAPSRMTLSRRKREQDREQKSRPNPKARKREGIE